MSEYQYYEFQAIDRPLGETVQAKLRATSTRARITSTSFTNHYEWGDFRGDPRRLMERWFDLHLYLANWGTRRLMIRLPKRVVERSRLDAFLFNVDWVEVWENGDDLVVDLHRDEVEAGYDDWDDGSGWLAAAPPHRLVGKGKLLGLRGLELLLEVSVLHQEQRALALPVAAQLCELEVQHVVRLLELADLLLVVVLEVHVLLL